MTALIVLRAFAALICAFRGWMRAALFLAVGVFYELVRMPFAAWRHGYPTPYVGHGFMLWLPEPALLLLLPAVLLGSAWKWSTGMALWAVAFAFVAVSYPSLRGEHLLRFYETVYLASYGATALVLTHRSAKRQLEPQEGLLLLYSLLGIAGVVLVVIWGYPNWSAVGIPNAFGYLASLGFAGVGGRRRRVFSPKP